MMHNCAVTGMHAVVMVGNATMHTDVLVCEQVTLNTPTDISSSAPQRLALAPSASAGMRTPATVDTEEPAIVKIQKDTHDRVGYERSSY